MSEVKLLTEREWRRLLTPHPFMDDVITAIGLQGLISPEPEKADPLRDVARQIIADTCDTHESKGQWMDGVWDDEHEMVIALAALRRGMELAPAARPLTREMVEKIEEAILYANTQRPLWRAELRDTIFAALTREAPDA